MVCHFLLQYLKLKSEVALSCQTLSDPMDCSLPGSSIHGIFQAAVLKWGCHCLDVGNLISGSFAFAKTTLNIWDFRVRHYQTLNWRILSIIY